MKVILPQLEATTGRTLSDAKGSSSSGMTALSNYSGITVCLCSDRKKN